MSAPAAADAPTPPAPRRGLIERIADRFHVSPREMLIAILPARVRSKVFRWYGEVKAIEARMHDGHADRDEELKRLGAIEASVNRLKIPLSFYHAVHLLRAHVDLVRRHLEASG